MKCSICIATYGKLAYLDQTLRSIIRQHPPFDWELIVVDDGSPDSSNYWICQRYPEVTYTRRSRVSGYRNPAAARNVTYRAAKGEVVVCQSDDVLHVREDTIERLVDELAPRHFVIATVINVDGNGRAYGDPNGKGFGDKLTVYTSAKKRRPLFFLGSLWRKDLYAVGGNDEDFTKPSGEDRWFALCLTRGLGLQATYSDILGHHQHHPHCDRYDEIAESQRLLKRKMAAAARGETPWLAAGGPWDFETITTAVPVAS